jgi:hypothetical protein
MRCISVCLRAAIIAAAAMLSVEGAAAQQQPDVNRPAGAPGGTSQAPTPAQQEAIKRILEQLRAQSQAIDARVRNLEQTIERQNQEIERLRSGKPTDAAPSSAARGVEAHTPTDTANTATVETTAAAEGAPVAEEVQSPPAATTPAVKRDYDPFASPADFLFELRARYADRFGTSAAPQPQMTYDHDDHSLAIKRWSVGQNRILSQPIEWKVRVLRMSASRGTPGGAVLLCVVDGSSEEGIDHTFEVDIPAADLPSVSTARAADVFTLVGIVDPRLSFSPEHERDDRWDRDGHVVGPLCVSNWRVQGLQLRPVSE